MKQTGVSAILTLGWAGITLAADAPYPQSMVISFLRLAGLGSRVTSDQLPIFAPGRSFDLARHTARRASSGCLRTRAETASTRCSAIALACARRQLYTV